MTVSSTSKLWQPLKVGRTTISQRIALAPLTRFRNDDDHVATDIMAQYYAERGSVPGTLLVTEATGISPAAEGQPNLPGVHNAAQAQAWKKVYDAIHAKGSFVYQQLWHQGRAVDAKYVGDRGFKYSSSSAKVMPGRDIAPEPLTEDEILTIIDDFRTAARNVVDAGGDGVEIHGAHGYLIDQFTRDSVNDRTDKWGGSVENRARFLLEIVKAVSDEIGADRTALRLSPFASFQDAVSSDTWTQTSYILDQIKARGHKLAYLSLVEPRGDPVLLFIGPHKVDPFAGGEKSLQYFLRQWDNYSPVIVTGAYDLEAAGPAVDQEYAGWDVIIGYGRPFISNPDLVFRIKNQIPFTEYNRKTFYLPKVSTGYIDYPFSEQAVKAGLGPLRAEIKL
ncbi:NADH:flavin oxidoreductase/NADH oxidase family protein [Cordyceps militaris CM01]|uniref:NADH:flavin oxidoreductase/NADH oxidase family protein n=2 Tax=Cordyceps militaris TaxID=73501 RepID=G3JDR7_CORMM|nr:NADH:flavin oxidoreductase/NADH oxidase family protein [Cordyceps militaris CM01]ATY64194.1 NADH:flavin oxidoreductase NADH oxidase family [Cordyceps militaris]EGX92742.1 NADH:flavin oxidoreductase/NADH oxidase family protein [Cordyceps militaris CM01]